MTGNCGFVYIVCGRTYLEESVISVSSLRDHMPDVPVTIITDEEVACEHFDEVIMVDEMRGDFGDQVLHIDKTPYEKSINVDSDILFTDAVDELFEMLDEFDVAAAHAPLRHSTGKIDLDEYGVPRSFPEYQSGVVAYKMSEAFREFHSKWQEIYFATMNTSVSNQASFTSALYHGDCRIATLPEEYNCTVRNPGVVNGTVKVIHNRLMDFDDIGAVKLIDAEAAAAQINSRDGRRVYYRSGERIKFVEPNLLMKFRDSVIRDGWLETFRKLP